MKSKTVLITGAAGGIGSETARTFAAAGYNVALNYHTSRQAAEELEKQLVAAGCDAVSVKADVADENQVDRMFQLCEEHFGGVDILINNAGTAQQKLFTDITKSDYDRIFDTNVRGCFNCCRAALPFMIRNKSGKIINVSSIWGVSGASCEVHYSAAKAAVIGLTKALAKEVGPSGIQVNCVAPGVIRTPMNAQFDEQTLKQLADETSLGRLGTPSDVAELILFLASEKANYITGQVIGSDGGFC
ncbi:MAG: elongation factor P 5-aminopentanone reductase [Acutalibacteraceae bacterium]|jgi:3-oxoacyl-[acyl-carrier protein] reductase